MDEDIFEKINNTLTTIEGLNIATKFKGDKLTASEFNSVIDKIEEIKNHLNVSTKNTFTDITSYVLDKIDNIKLSVNASDVIIDGTASNILNELNNIQTRLSVTEIRSVTNANDISGINLQLNNIEEKLGIVNDIIDEVQETVQTSYDTAKQYTDEKVEESYNKLYTHITDTTLTFDYDIKTEPEPDPKTIYDNDNDLYDGEYHE